LEEAWRRYPHIAALSKEGPELRKCVEGKTLVLDGASIHLSKQTIAWFAKHKIEVLEGWPAHSPDLNPIENWWSLLRADIADHKMPGVQAEDRAYVWELVKAVTRLHDQDHFSKYVLPFPGRIKKLIEVKGGFTGQ
jgi:hypothetical protein